MMRAGTRKAILFAVLAGIVGWLALDSRVDGLRPGVLSPGAGTHDVGKESAEGSQDAAQDKRAGRYALPERAPLGEPRAELFGTRSWQPLAPKVAAARSAPAVPPMPYRFAGKLLQEGRLQILLARDDVVIPVREGDTLDGAYRVESIGEAQITLLYLPLKHKESIPVSSSLPLAAAAPATQNTAPAAQLLWQGPQSVKAGTPFSVALRVTSKQPVYASPMQFQYDPKLLETVTVKPGKFFSQNERDFSYRVNPAGSIFIGASKRSHTLADDAEFVVLTFKPLKPAPVAELSVSSLNLQGSAGRAIAFDPLGAFKTAITP
jgi:hypothetical protein